jgi:hypothetical protein
LKKIKNIFPVLLLASFLTSCSDGNQHRVINYTKPTALNAKNGFAYLDDINDPNYLIALLDNPSKLKGAYIGWGGSPSHSYAIYERLSLIASDTSLLRLTTHNNPKLRVYGMWGLANKNRQLALSCMKALKNDQTKLVYHSGCIIFQTTVAEVCKASFDSTELALMR